MARRPWSKGLQGLSDGTQSLYGGLQEAYTGSQGLHQGSQSLSDASGRLAEGAAQVSGGAGALSQSSGALVEGVGQLAQGSPPGCQRGRRPGGGNPGADSWVDQLAGGAGVLRSGTRQLSSGAALSQMEPAGWPRGS